MRLESSLIWPKRLHWEKYFRPQTISEALQILEEFQGQARLLAGGTDLIPQIRNRETEPKVLVDITRIPGLGEIKLEDGVIKIGALVTHVQAAQSPLLREKALALSEGASQLGSPQIRNLGTVAGNLVSGQPGADTNIPLLALDAKVKVMKKQGEQTIPLMEFFLDTGKTVGVGVEVAVTVMVPVMTNRVRLRVGVGGVPIAVDVEVVDSVTVGVSEDASGASVIAIHPMQ